MRLRYVSGPVGAAQRIVENHGGAIEVGNNVESGARFTVLLPAIDKPATIEETSDPPAPESEPTAAVVSGHDLPAEPPPPAQAGS